LKFFLQEGSKKSRVKRVNPRPESWYWNIKQIKINYKTQSLVNPMLDEIEKTKLKNYCSNEHYFLLKNDFPFSISFCWKMNLKKNQLKRIKKYPSQPGSWYQIN